MIPYEQYQYLLLNLVFVYHYQGNDESQGASDLWHNLVGS
jgi:hypothetical protein